MGHTLRAVPVPAVVRAEDPGAKAYALGGCRIFVGTRETLQGLLHFSVSRPARDRLPTLEELREICAKVPEIDVPVAIYMGAEGQGVTGSSTVVHLWEWSLGRPPPIFVQPGAN